MADWRGVLWGVVAIVASLLFVSAGLRDGDGAPDWPFGMAMDGAATFGGFACRSECAGHVAGYRWAEQREITDEDECPSSRSQSFHEGCVVRVREPKRGASKDDAGRWLE